MDKITRALAVAEDNTAAINALMQSGERRSRKKTLSGVTSGAKTSFGTIESDGNAAVIVVFDDPSAMLSFQDAVTGGVSPLFLVLPRGKAELELSPVCKNARALLFCG